MARLARGQYMNPTEVQIFHTIQRCVRQAYLCGHDDRTGCSYEHRRQWIRDRLEVLASIFGVDCLTYTILSNHLHLVLRSRPDVVEQWSDEEVARRWWKLFPQRRDELGQPSVPTDAELASMVNDPVRLGQLRLRLSDISWWMRCTSEDIARQANAEDETSGRFWSGRFRAVALLDEAAVLACSIYVDLNPIRAAMAETPETSEFTGAKDRIDDLQFRELEQPTDEPPTFGQIHDWERDQLGSQSGWLNPIEIDELNDPTGADVCSSGLRASNKGYLNVRLKEYLELLDWTGRSIRADKWGAIPAQLAPILERIGLRESGWCNLVKNFGRLFYRAAGQADALQQEAERRHQNYLQAPDLSQFSTATTPAMV